MNTFGFLFRPATIVILSMFMLLQACSKRPDQIGAGIQPDKDLIGIYFTDTVSIVAYSIPEDSVRTDKPENILLGSIKDPIFGTTLAGFYTQVRLSTSSINFGPNPQLDSLVLQLAYSGYHGDTTTQLTIRVHELEESIFYDSMYYSNTHKNYGSTDYAAFSFAPRPRTRFVWAGDTLRPAFRIRLSDVSPALGNKILTADSVARSSNEKFVQHFKGLFVNAEAVASNGSIVSLDLPNNLSRMTLYYRNDEKDSLKYEFFIGQTEARFNRYDHLEYADADPTFRNQVILGDTLLGRNLLYVQSMSGVKTRLRFPNLSNFSQAVGKKVVVNEAKLIFTGRSLDTTMFFAPQRLALVRSNSDGTYSLMPDQLEGDSYFGGSYKAISNKYEFRITRYVQDMILRGQGKQDSGLLVFVVGASSRANRWVFNGTNPHPDSLSPLKLLVNYSVVND